jgi:hypothetical protein
MGNLEVGPDGRGRLLTAHAVGTGAGVAFELTHELLADGDHVVLVREQGGPVVAAGAIPRATGAPTQLPRTGGMPVAAVVWVAVVALLGLAAVLPRRAGGAR